MVAKNKIKIDNKNFRTNKYLFIWIFISILFLINPYDRTAMFLDFIFVVLFGLLLFTLRRKFEFSEKSLIFITILIFLNLIGFYYGMERVPIHFFIDFFNLERNPYDRFLHFCFGFFAFFPLKEILSRKFGSDKNGFLYVVVFFVIMGIGGVYEIVEWGFSQRVSIESAEIYLGFQGDEWDTQKDLLMKGLGALSYIFICCFGKMLKRNYFYK